MQRKQKQQFIQQFLLLCQSSMCVHQSTTMHSDAESGCAAACLQEEECTHMCHGTVVNTCWRLTQKRRNCWCWIKSLLLFLRTSWTVEPLMSFLRFWALNMVVALLSMQGQKALGFHPKYINLCYKDERISYGFGTTRGWVINNIILILGWIIPLITL